MANVVSSINSSRTPLTNGESFVGLGEIVTGYSTVTVTLRGSATVAGTLYLGFSSDNATWTEVSVAVSDPTTQTPITVAVTNTYFRVRYVNGSGTLNPFRIQSVYLVNPTAGSQGPPGPTGPQGPAGPATVNLYRDVFTIDNTTLTAKSFTLSMAPTTASTVRFEPQGGVKQVYGTDFIVSGTTLSWNGLGLDGFLEVGDVIEVYYIA